MVGANARKLSEVASQKEEKTCEKEKVWLGWVRVAAPEKTSASTPGQRDAAFVERQSRLGGSQGPRVPLEPNQGNDL